MDHKPLRYQQLANAYSYNTFCTTGRPIVLCVFLGAWAYTELDLNLIQQKIDHTLGKKMHKSENRWDRGQLVDNPWNGRCRPWKGRYRPWKGRYRPWTEVSKKVIRNVPKISCAQAAWVSRWFSLKTIPTYPQVYQHLEV